MSARTGTAAFRSASRKKRAGLPALPNLIYKTQFSAFLNLYPLIAPVIGGIGCFVTGSATSACIMFANLQNEVAAQLGVNPYWLVAANSAGATAGKMISPQSIAVAVAAVSATGQDGVIMRKTILWCVLYLIIVCIMCFAGA